MSHTFKVYNYSGPTNCDSCKKFLWGFVKQGYQCEGCKFNSHKKCLSEVCHLPCSALIQVGAPFQHNGSDVDSSVVMNEPVASLGQNSNDIENNSSKAISLHSNGTGSVINLTSINSLSTLNTPQLPTHSRTESHSSFSSITPTVEVSSNLITTCDNRSMVIRELLETERKYVADLDTLYKYSKDVQQNNLLEESELCMLFSNLPDLLRFQSKFLSLMEETFLLPSNEQRIGLLFSQHELNFVVYEKFCANYKKATQFLLQEGHKLNSLKDVIEPFYGLPSYLIKPIQRICKYPLLIKEIIKYSEDKSYPFMDEILIAEDVMKRVTQKINELKRLEENEEIKNSLKEQLINSSNLNMEEFGNLLLHDKFPMVSKSVESDYSLFLFQRIMLCCKPEAPKKKKIKSSKIEIPQFSLRGSIYVSSIGGVQDTSIISQQVFGLKVFWKDGDVMETFALNCKNMEQATLWKSRLETLMEAEKSRRRASVYALQQSVRNRVFRVEDDTEDFDYRSRDSGYSSTSGGIRPRGRSDAGDTSSDALYATANYNASQRSRSRTSYTRSKSQPRTQTIQPLWDTNNLPPVPVQYRRKNSENFISPYTPTILNNTIAPQSAPIQNMRRPSRDQRSGERRGSRDDRLEKNLPKKSRDERLGEPRNDAEARMLARRSQILFPTQETYTLEDDSRLRLNATTDAVNKTDAEARLSAKLKQLRQSSNATREREKTAPTSPEGFTMKILATYAGDVFQVAVSPEGLTYKELVLKIEKKIKIFHKLAEDKRLRIKYLDNNKNEYLLINSDSDVMYAFNSSFSRGTFGEAMNLYCSQI
ncbi:hypothetical protein HDU92_008536 [Lobulomyces angularis]|nr:hypothetical protein HDU92_008536 [Lobulomyces angularis]